MCSCFEYPQVLGLSSLTRWVRDVRFVGVGIGEIVESCDDLLSRKVSASYLKQLLTIGVFLKCSWTFLLNN